MRNKKRNAGYSAVSKRLGRNIVGAVQAYLDEQQSKEVKKEMDKHGENTMSGLFFFYLENYSKLEQELRSEKRKVASLEDRYNSLTLSIGNLYKPAKFLVKLIETNKSFKRK